MERPRTVEPQPSGAAVAFRSGAPAGVAIVVTAAFVFLLMVRAGFRGSVALP